MKKSAYLNKYLVAIGCLLSFSVACAGQNELEGDTLYDLSQKVSEATGYTIVISPRVKVNREVEIYSPDEISKEELFQVYQSILSLYGYAAIRNGDFVRVVHERKSRSMPMPVLPKNKQ